MRSTREGVTSGLVDRAGAEPNQQHHDAQLERFGQELRHFGPQPDQCHASC